VSLQLFIEPTRRFARVEGVKCRVWEGTTESGEGCLVYVVRVALPLAADQSAFEGALLALGTGPLPPEHG
jgi:hypothetical protein